MTVNNLSEILSPEVLDSLFPHDRADSFFDALYGDSKEGAYDISLEFKSEEKDKLNLEFVLRQRPSKCLACNLTHGLPHVFEKHPVIGVKKLVEEIGLKLGEKTNCEGFDLGTTKERSREIHTIALTIHIKR